MNNKHTRCELIVHGKEYLGDAITDEISLLINHICQIKKKEWDTFFSLQGLDQDILSVHFLLAHE